VTAAEGQALIERSWVAWLEKDRRASKPHATVWASSWRACDRRMVYDLVVPDQQLPFDADTLARFQRGNDRESDLFQHLVHIGKTSTPTFAIEGQQQRFEVKGRDGVVITGRVDGFLRFKDEKQRAPIECKAWHPNVVERIATFEDVFENVWTRGGGYQLLAYLFDSGEPYGFMLLDRSGLPRLLLVEMSGDHWRRMEAFLAKAERAVEHAKAGTLPDYIDDQAECKRCPFYGHVCQPPLQAKGAVLTDPELEAALEEWWALRESGKRWRDLDEQVKKQLRGVEAAVAGHFSISGKWGTQAKLTLPPEIRKQFTISDPKGRFTLEVERL